MTPAPLEISRFRRGLMGSLALAVFGGLAWAALDRPAVYPGVAEIALDRLPQTGATNPVTAVLLDFRGYDTFLEVGVLLVAAIGVLALAGRETQVEAVPPAARTLVHGVLLRLLLPLMVLVGLWMLWAGTSQPGGAFQAGAVLGAALILMALAGREPPRFRDTAPVRAAAALGFAGFLAAALLFFTVEGMLLAYPPVAKTALIVAIEVGICLSTAASLALFYLRPAGPADAG
ncbi:MAG: sodium:proton antiporter [Rhodospirillales bacterium]|nr:MAG: sodium:proton antiporter [Rhodospirillales bacterium]